MSFTEGGGFFEKTLSVFTRTSVLLEDLNDRCDMQVYVYETITVCMVTSDCQLWVFFAYWSMNGYAMVLNFVQLLLTIIFEPSYKSYIKTYD